MGQKRIADNVHGTIELTEIESKITDTPCFQRLRNIKQLGLANLVYPGTNYSRLSHSLGVCYLTGRTLDALKKNTTIDLSPDDEQKYRLAGLLHDIGHYPFSHATEDAANEFYRAQLLTTTTQQEDDNKSNQEQKTFDNHEALGAKILQTDPDISSILESYSIDPLEISRIFNRETPPQYANLVSSDLDADRIDFLLRTSRHSGLPYGSIDLDYLLTQLRIDAENKICLTKRAIKAADHFLLGRYFDYQQVAYHKTVVGLELMLKEVIHHLLTNNIIDLSSTMIKDKIQDSSWQSYDDNLFIRHIETLSKDGSNPTIQRIASSIIKRTPPKLVFQNEHLGERKNSASDVSTEHTLRKRLLTSEMRRIAEQKGIDPKHWKIWTKDIPLTKIGSHIPVSASVASDEPEALDQAIRIMNDENQTSKPIMESQDSLMSVLSDKALYIERLYVLFPATEEGILLRNEIAEEINQAMNRDE